MTRRLTRLLEDAAPDGWEVYPEWGWRLPNQQDYQPDIMVAVTDAADILRTPPLLVVEVTSQSTRAVDYGRKLAIYAEFGASWYWIVDLDHKELLIHQNRDGHFFRTVRMDRGAGRLSEPFRMEVDLDALWA